MHVQLDRCVIHVSDWERSNTFYQAVLGAKLIQRGQGWAYRFGTTQLNCPGIDPVPVARLPVQPVNSDLCFVWSGTVDEAISHLADCGVSVEFCLVERFGAQGTGISV